MHFALHALKQITKHLIIFLLIYICINLWRAPVSPTTPILSYHTPQGQYIDAIAQSHHRPILVYFWGSWCGVCRITSPNVQALHDANYPILTVAVSSGDTQELGAYMAQHHYTFATINDSQGELFSLWQGQVTPSFVILSNGKVVQRFTGITPLWLLKVRLWWANVSL